MYLYSYQRVPFFLVGGSDGNKKGRNLVEAGAVDWSGVALDALAALYYAPV